MIRINLLPFRAARKKENVRRQISIFSLSVFFVTVALFYYNSVLANQVTELQDNVNSSKAQLTRLQAKVKEAQALENKLKILQQKRKVIEDLDASREDAVRLMEKMTEVIVPGRMWLASFAATGDSVKIDGTAMDNKTVADFMTNLQKVEQFSNVNLVVTSQKAIKPGVFFKSFSINFTRTQMKPDEKEDKAQE
jgi:type IV pilus assembly protein PilN